MIRIKKNPKNENLINDLIIKRTKNISLPPVFHELYSYDIYYHGDKIGYAWVNKTHNWINKVEIYPKYRRQGINSYIYDYIEQDLNIKLKPSKNLSSDGAAFWQNRLKKQNPTDKSLLSKIQIQKERIKIPKDKFRPRNTYYTEYQILLNDKIIGKAQIKKNKSYISWIEIDKNFQRKGLSTYLYDYIEKDLEIKLKPSINQLDDGVAFWKSRK